MNAPCMCTKHIVGDKLETKVPGIGYYAMNRFCIEGSVSLFATHFCFTPQSS